MSITKENNVRYSDRYWADPKYRAWKLEYGRNYQRKLRELARNNPNEPKAQRLIEYRRKYQRERIHKDKEEAEKIFGKKCFLCGYSAGRIELHNIDGQKHPSNNYRRAIENKDKFVALCSLCHRMITQMSRVLNISWSQVLELKHDKVKQ